MITSFPWAQSGKTNKYDIQASTESRDRYGGGSGLATPSRNDLPNKGARVFIVELNAAAADENSSKH